MSIILKDKFSEIIKNKDKKPTVVLACANDESTLESISEVVKANLANAILVGDKKTIAEILEKFDDDVKNYEVVDNCDMLSCADTAVRIAAEKKADVLMKGLIDSSYLLKAILKKENGLTVSFLSHLAVASLANEDKIYMLTDAGVNIAPDLECKKNIIENSVKVAHALGFDKPNVACLCAKEKVYDKMIATTDAAALQKMNQDGIIKNCVISGPLALDNIVSKEAAQIKKIDDPVAGNADIILAPNIETGNALLKSMVFIAGAQSAGIIVGTNVPIVFTSRADDYETKMNAIYLALAAS